MDGNKKVPTQNLLASPLGDKRTYAVQMWAPGMERQPEECRSSRDTEKGAGGAGRRRQPSFEFHFDFS